MPVRRRPRLTRPRRHAPRAVLIGGAARRFAEKMMKVVVDAKKNKGGLNTVHGNKVKLDPTVLAIMEKRVADGIAAARAEFMAQHGGGGGGGEGMSEEDKAELAELRARVQQLATASQVLHKRAFCVNVVLRSVAARSQRQVPQSAGWSRRSCVLCSPRRTRHLDRCQALWRQRWRSCACSCKRRSSRPRTLRRSSAPPPRRTRGGQRCAHTVALL